MFCTEEEFLKIVADADSALFNEVLSRVYNRAIEKALCHIPDVVNKLSRKIEQVNKVLGAYFTDNPHFLEYKDVVIQVVQQLEIEYTGMPFEDIIAKATPIIEKRISNIKGGLNANS